LQGGSTITQQYVKKAYLSSSRTLTRKLKEAALAVKLERSETKAQILTDYLNTIYFGRGAYGVQAAAQAYFAKDVGQLGLPEASLLAGLIREPENADPARDPTLARAHQADTLAAMVRDKKISAADASAVESQDMSSYVISPSHSASIVSQAVQTSGDAYFLDAVRQQLIATYGEPVVDGGGLRVYTTLDQGVQAKAYDAVYGPGRDALHPERTDPSGAMVSIAANGEVKALVGGQDHNVSQVNLALGTAGGGSGRQAGSTFKAFMLAEVIKEGYSAESTFPAPPSVVIPHGNSNGGPWKVTNFEHEAGSPAMSLVDATANSVNTVYAQVVDRIGAQKLDQMAFALGIKPSELPGAYPSSVLGTADVSPLEMAAAYATFANRGVYNSPVFITKVTKADGTPMPLPARVTRQALSPHEADTVTTILQQVVVRGTGVAAGGVGSPVAGKTGTTENSADAWFIGYTPRLTTATWMGYPSSSRPMNNFRGAKSVQGGGVPAQIWHDFMSSLLQNNPEFGGPLSTVVSFSGQTLSPPAPGTLQFPEGMGATTTTAAPTTTTIPGATTTTRHPTTSVTPTTNTTVTTPPTTAPGPPPTT
ncbi:MAG: transglycosylase domain-containing protein, partial [Acidimicrobiales bacterium]